MTWFKRLSPIFLFPLSLFSHSVVGQITGVIENPAGATLPFVNILINGDPHLGVTADLDGRFVITTEKVVQLDFSYVGYQPLRMVFDRSQPPPPQLRVVLQPADNALTAVEVVAGENPADRIIREAVSHRKYNDPEKALAAYQCRTYNKQVYRFQPDSAILAGKTAKMDTGQVKQIDRFVRSSADHDFFILESVTNRKFRSPGQLTEQILYSKASGFKSLPLAPLAADVQPFSFYQAEVRVFEKSYLNPVSPGSEAKYFFSLDDTLYREADTLFVISFHPRKGKNFDGLKGVLYIHSHRYGISNLIAGPADTTGNLTFSIEQQYQLVGGETWFPSQLHFEFALPKYPMPGIGMSAYGRSYIDSLNLEPVFERKDFRTAEKYSFSDNAFRQPDSLWLRLRAVPLSDKELRTYAVVDSFGEVHHLDRWMNRIGLLSTGRLPIGPLDLDFRRGIGFSEYEGLRLGAGIYTSERLLRAVAFGGYAAYGFKDKRWKYGLEGTWRIDPDRDRAFTVSYTDDLEEPAVMPGFPEPGFLTRRTFARRMDQWRGWAARLEGQVVRSLDAVAEVRSGQVQPLYMYRFNGSQETAGSFDLTEVSVHLRYTPGELYTRFFGVRVSEGDGKYPGLFFSWRRGWQNGTAAGLEFDQVWAGIGHKFRIRWLGETSYRFEGGAVTGNPPYQRLYSSTGVGIAGIRANHEFQTMAYQEFLSDRLFVSALRHNFGKLLFRTSWLQPVLSVEQRFAIGALGYPERYERIEFKTLEKGFWESGIILDNLIRINYFNIVHFGFGVAAYRRFGAYQLEGGWKQNSVIRLSFYAET